MRFRFRVEGELGNDRPMFCYFVKQFPVFRRVDFFKTTAQNGDGLAHTCKGALMRGGIYTSGHAADNSNSLGGKIPAQPQGGLNAVMGGISGTHH